MVLGILGLKVEGVTSHLSLEGLLPSGPRGAVTTDQVDNALDDLEADQDNPGGLAGREGWLWHRAALQNWSVHPGVTTCGCRATVRFYR